MLTDHYSRYFSIYSQIVDIIIENYIYICDSVPRDVFLGVLYGYKMILQIIALLLAFFIRKVKVKGLNDAKYIGAATYVTSIVLAVVIVAIYSLKDIINGFAALFSTGFLVGTTVILMLVFIPLASPTIDTQYSFVILLRYLIDGGSVQRSNW